MGYSLFLVLITIVCLLLILAIMVQNPKGGGLSSSFGGGSQVGGVQKTNDFLDKSTWTLGGILIALILFSSLSFGGGNSSESKILNEQELNAPLPTAPAVETPAPAATETAPATEATPAETAE